MQLQYVDEFATTCVEVGAATPVFTGVLTGSISGNELVARFKSAGCGPLLVLRAADGFDWIFEYDVEHGHAVRRHQRRTGHLVSRLTLVDAG